MKEKKTGDGPFTASHEESEKAGLKLNIQEAEIMASYLITSLQ